jgi:outer membrane lipoprotein-sorting protein
VIADAGRERRRRGATAVLGVGLALAAGCGGRPVSLPTAGGVPFPDAAAAYAEATSLCRNVRTLSAELALSGHAGAQKLRGRIMGGFAEPGQVRLEAPAPFGKPVFTLVVRDGTATLVLNRARRVIRDAPPAALVEALAGVALGPDELRAAVAGCGLGAEEVSSGQSFPGNWLALEGTRSRVWLRRVESAWQVAASSRDQIELRYESFSSGRPSIVRLRTTPPQGPGTELTLRLSQLDINVPFGDDVFELEIPDDATPLSLDELRRSGLSGADEAAHMSPAVDGSRAARP